MAWDDVSVEAMLAPITEARIRAHGATEALLSLVDGLNVAEVARRINDLEEGPRTCQYYALKSMLDTLVQYAETMASEMRQVQTRVAQWQGWLSATVPPAFQARR